MLIKKPTDIPSSEITSKSLYLNRRKFIGSAAAFGAALATGVFRWLVPTLPEVAERVVVPHESAQR